MIHQAKSNPQLLDVQIFSERLASAISPIGTFRSCQASHRMSAPEGATDMPFKRVDFGS
jgi:hypothetical protein